MREWVNVLEGVKHDVDQSLTKIVFDNMNSDPEMLKYQIDLHYLNRFQALRQFQTHYRRIYTQLKMGRILPNISLDYHIMKVLCGHGYGRADPKIPGLKEFFL